MPAWNFRSFLTSHPRRAQARCNAGRPVAAALVGLVLLFIPRSTGAETRSLTDAVVRLSADSQGCGTGFFIEQGAAIVTNVHVAKLFCRGFSCPAVRVEHEVGRRFESALPSDTIDLRLRIALPSIDLAILDLPSAVRSPFALSFSQSPLKPGTAITMVGFPRCGSRVESSGIISDVTTLSFLTAAQGASGSSGSPVLNAAGEVVGVAFQAESLLRTVYDRIGFVSYPLRAVRSELLAKLSALPPESLRGSEADLLSDFYLRDIAPAQGDVRLKRGLQFLNASRVLGLTISGEPSSPELLRGAALVDTSPDAILQRTAPVPVTAEGKSMELLSFITNLESRGVLGTTISSLTPEGFAAALRSQGWSPEDIEKFLAIYPTSSAAHTPGVLPMLGIIGAILATLAALLLSLWASSLGYVYARGKGGRLRRCLRTIAVGVLLWPISLVLFRITLARAAKKSAPKKALPSKPIKKAPR